jgi:DNA-binding CsgD family transcriptional regulator
MMLLLLTARLGLKPLFVAPTKTPPPRAPAGAAATPGAGAAPRRGLATLGDPSPADLTPRQRQALRYLLEGDAEKQVAARLGVSTLTVHDHVKALYRHFGVASRPELLAYFLRRSGLRFPGPDLVIGGQRVEAVVDRPPKLRL